MFISDWLKLLHESKEENAIYFVFLEMCKQKFEVTEFEFPASKVPNILVVYLHFRNIMALLSTVCLHFRNIMALLSTLCLHYRNFMALLSTLCLHDRKLISLVIVLIL
jgi:hypothetical protein